LLEENVVNGIIVSGKKKEDRRKITGEENRRK
jgi:hypothetical protein